MSLTKGLIFPTHFEVKEKVDQSAERTPSLKSMLTDFSKSFGNNHKGHSIATVV